jgi:Uma2 family endonuclease
MPGTTRSITADELLRLPNDGRRYELVRGELRVNPPAGWRHGSVGARVAMLVGRYVDSKRLGLVLTESGYLLATGPDTVRGPDVSFIAQARVRAAGGAAYFEGAPDLAVEILSPSNRRRDVEEKIGEYFAAGGRMAWVVDPKQVHLTVHRPGDAPVTLDAEDTVDGGDVLPGFTCGVREMLVWPS